ncbi:MAG: DUF1192 domain-containing protein [Hyphomonadaceae bacterium]|nr:DUF1192 domain-containing protein [Hyphomonadaceae bacterium]
MIEDDPFAPAPKKPVSIELMSIGELEARIVALEAEIEVCKKAIASKRAQRSAADSLFSGPPAS